MRTGDFTGGRRDAAVATSGERIRNARREFQNIGRGRRGGEGGREEEGKLDKRVSSCN